MYMSSHRYPGNADVLVGWVTDDSARSREHADEDVGVPRVGCKLFFREKPRTEG